MICQKCGAQNDDGSLFCMTCGEKLEAPVEKHDGIAFCPYCGSKLNEGGAFCTACGRQVVSGAKEAAVSAGNVTAGSAPKVKGRKCRKCKATIPADTSICPQCGTDFESFGPNHAAAAFGMAVFFPLAGLIYAIMGLKKFKTPATRKNLILVIVFSVVMWIVWFIVLNAMS